MSLRQSKMGAIRRFLGISTYNNIFNIINDGILLQFSASSTSSYYCRRRSTMMRVHDAGVLCTIVFGIVDSTSRVSAALWAAIIRGYCNGYTHKVGGFVIKKCRANSCYDDFENSRSSVWRFTPFLMNPCHNPNPNF